jgi:membrane protease YdiL (CAAX protease family)
MVDDTPIIIAATVYLTVAVMGAVILGTLWWLTACVRPPWLPMQRVRQISWNGADVFMAFLIFNGLPILADEALQNAGFFEWLYGPAADPATRERQLLWSIVLATPLVLGLIVLGLNQLRGTRLSELGITPGRIGNNIAIGYVLWLIITPAAYAIYYLALVVTPEEWVVDHPISKLAEQPLVVSEWLLLLVGSIVLAPVVEELIFRGLLLPWQMRAGLAGQWVILVLALLVGVG